MKIELSQDYLDRFGALGRLYGEDALPRLHSAHVAVVGIGGVGSWAAEALARSGIGRITLVDLDDICITNTNRQLHALESEIGRPKVSVIADRLRLINPECEVTEIIQYFTETSTEEILAANFDIVIDAIDTLSHKAHLIGTCHQKGIPIIVSGGAGGKSDPSAVSAADLAFATNDRLLKILRRDLRARYGFPLEPTQEPFQIRCVHSHENARYPWTDGTVREDPEPGSHLRLNCDSGFGTASPVTGTFGFVAASQAIEEILGIAKPLQSRIVRKKPEHWK